VFIASVSAHAFVPKFGETRNQKKLNLKILLMLLNLKLKNLQKEDRVVRQ